MHIHTHTQIHVHVHTHVHVHVRLRVRVRVGGRGKGGEESGGGWVGGYVLVRMCVLCVVCADSRQSFPQDKNGAQQLHQVKRMIGGLGNVLFSTCSQTLNG